MLALAISAGAAAVLLVAAVIDLRSRRIPNWTVAALLAGYLGALAADPASFPPGGLAAAGLLLAVTLPAYAAGWFGAGDVKLAAAAAAWAGWAQMDVFLAATGVVGGGTALAVLAGGPRGRPASGRRRTVPYGPALAAGGTAAVLMRTVPQLAVGA